MRSDDDGRETHTFGYGHHEVRHDDAGHEMQWITDVTSKREPHEQRYVEKGDTMNTFLHGTGMGLFPWIFPLVLLLGVIYLTQSRRPHKRSSAQEILDKRYASGGISKEEYEEKSRDLQEHT